MKQKVLRQAFTNFWAAWYRDSIFNNGISSRKHRRDPRQARRFRIISRGFQRCSCFTVAVGAFGFLLTTLCLVDLRHMTLNIGGDEVSVEVVNVSETRNSQTKEDDMSSF